MMKTVMTVPIASKMTNNFHLQSPTESCKFTYPNPSSDNDIVFELKGFHEDSEQIYGTLLDLSCGDLHTTYANIS